MNSDHVDAASLSASEVLSGMRHTLVKVSEYSRLKQVNGLFQSKQLLHTLEKTLRTFIIDLETQIEVDSQLLEV